SGLEIHSDGSVRIASTAAGDGLTGGGGSALSVSTGTGLNIDNGDVAVDTTVVALQSQKYSADVGAGTDVTVTHNLGTRDVIVQVFTKASPYDTVLCDVERTTENSVTLKFASAVGSGDYRVVIHG